MVGLLAAALAAVAVTALLPALARFLRDDCIAPAHRLWATRHFPEPPAGSWWLGHVGELVRQRFQTYRVFGDWARAYGPVYRVRFFHRPVLVVSDPEHFAALFRPATTKKYLPPYRMFEIFTNPFRANILSSAENDTWRASRRAAAAALTMANLRLSFPHIAAVTQRLIASLEAAGPAAVHDMDAAAAAITVDVIGLAAFHRDLRATAAAAAAAAATPAAAAAAAPAAAAAGGQPGREQAAAAGPGGGDAGGGAAAADEGVGTGIGGSLVFPRGPEVLDIINHLVVAMQARNNPLNRWLPTKARRELFEYGGRFSDMVRDLTASLEAHPPPPHTLGAHLLAAKYSNGQPLDRDQIMADIGIMWGAGFETTAHTICWTLFLLATHPEAEARLCAELDGLGLLASPQRPAPAELKWEHLGQLRYLSAVVNESMRLFPVASSGTIRVTHAPIELAGHRLPAGQPLLIHTYATHRSPALWGPDPDAFRPERFMPGGGGGGAAAAAAGGLSGNVDGEEEDDYVDVAADLAASRDQDGGTAEQLQQQNGKQQQPGKRGSAPAAPSTRASLEAKSSLQPDDSGLGPDRHPGFLPFSTGPRSCVGQALALVELKAVLAMLLGTFVFQLDPQMGGYAGVQAAARQTVTLRPGGGMLMRLRRRAEGGAGCAGGGAAA